ncbi:MAG TPA: PAS domain-containing protein, partial [Thermoplasmata archaeon]|nr:PAS domain-containing protein [Thermoplasmata archaeon]
MAQTAPSALAAPNPGAPFAVLVIDGNEEHQILSVSALGRRGFRVTSVASGKEGMRLALSQTFDAIVLGHKLRDSPGVELMRVLSERIPHVPTIFVVSPDAEDAALRAIDAGAAFYIVKTPRYTELLPAMVEEQIQEAQNRRRLADVQKVQAKVLTERKTVEEELSRSQARLRMVLEQAPILLWSTDTELRVTSLSGAGVRSLEPVSRPPKGLTLQEYFNTRDEDVEPIASHRKALAGASVSAELDWLGRSFDMHLEPLRSPDGAIIGTIGVAFDVTERQHSQESLRLSEERFQLLGRATSDVIWDWDLQTDGMWTNENFTTVFGYDAEEVEPTGAWWENHLHPDDRERIVRRLEQLIQSGETAWTAEYRFRRKDGTFAMVVDRGYVLHDASGRPLRMIGSAMDVTKQRRADAIQSAVYRISEATNAARDLPELYRALHTIIGGLMPATNFYIAIHDREAERLIFPYFVDEEEGPPQPQPLGRGLTEYVLRTGRPLLASPEVFDRLVRQGEVVSVGPPSVDWVGAPLVSQGATIGVIVVQSYTEGVRFQEEDKAILNFVSEQVAMAIERKRAQENAIEAERRASVGQLAGFIAHELSTPLTNISHLTTAIGNQTTSAAIREKLDEIETERRRAADIIRGLHALSQSHPIAAVATDLRQIVESAMGQVEIYRNEGVHLDVEVGDAPVLVNVDPGQIEEVVVNLIGNALDVTSRGSVRVRLEERPDGAAISVSDMGRRIRKEDLAHLF